MFPAKDDLERAWAERVKAAKVRYEQAREGALAAQREWKVGALPYPDGGFALRRALLAETEASIEYRRVLHIFTDLLVIGKKPPAD